MPQYRARQERENALPAFSLYLATLLAIALAAVVLEVYRGQRQLRNPATWMPCDTTSEVRISGVVEEVREFPCPWSGMRLGEHVILRTADGAIEVHLADVAYLHAHGIYFNKGERLDVIGARMSYQGHGAIIAREIFRTGERLAFRDTDGTPVWTGDLQP